MYAKVPPTILFLTTQDPAQIKPEWPYYQNWTLPQVIRERGATVSIRCWQDPALGVSALSKYDIITFLWCNNYHNHAPKFLAFVRNVLIPAQKLSPKLRVVNDPAVILWNVDKKIYIPDLEREGFLVSETVFIGDSKTPDTVSDLLNHVRSFSHDAPLVLKPSISGSSKQTHLIRNPSKPTAADMDFLRSVARNGVDGCLILQKYEPAIEHGEYSLIFLNGKHTHTMLKTPCQGEFRVQHEFGGGIAELERGQVPEKAADVAFKIMRYMQSRFGVVTSGPDVEQESHIGQSSSFPHDGVAYVRVDGVIRENGDFVLMEVEAIEPHLWLETALTPGCQEELYRALLGS